MATKSDPLSDSFGTDSSDGWLGGFVADEDDLDRYSLWRLGLWGVAAAGAVTLGILSAQLPLIAQGTQVAANDFAGHARQVEARVHENQLEARRLSAAIDTLNSDRDRLFSRLSALEQGLDVVTGSIKRADEKATSSLWPDATAAPIISAAPFAITVPAAAPTTVAAAASAPAVEPERVPAQPALTEPSPAEPPAAEAAAQAAPPAIQAMPIPEPQGAPEVSAKPAEETPVPVAEFGLDLGGANSVSALRALWRGLLKSHKAQLDGLRPLLAVQERRNGLGLQLRLIAGPIRDAAAAARICAALSDADRACKTTTFDGQRLSFAEEPEQRATPPRPAKQRKSTQARPTVPDTAQAAPEPRSSVATMLGFR